ncbi:uncharacterized protein PRCAT00004555001 [Priceomyces carsonii]|uniref:uncharacterized protein n=1 Tax=Priceomyces carsonii TaxID=28549 RepID=UPI002EDA17A9|nr:unnamed protein product [Priceomyces carsonii]
MIRRNWSLADDVRKNEKRRQQKVQERQKFQFKNDKLSKVDPVRLYRQIQRLEANGDDSEAQKKYLKNLKSDWEFIIEHNMHKEIVEPFLKKVEQEEKKSLQEKRKLWGRQSIYFNPELNPLGKVPNHLSDLLRPLPNLTKPLKVKEGYKIDPLIDELGVVLPEGDPPKFYKMVQNTEKPTYEDTIKVSKKQTPSNAPGVQNKKRKVG